MVGVVVAETAWTNVLRTDKTHMWELYETPTGIRTTTFTALHKHSKENDHGYYAAVCKWRGGLCEVRRGEDGNFGFVYRKNNA